MTVGVFILNPYKKITFVFTVWAVIIAGVPQSSSNSPQIIECEWLHTQGPRFQKNMEDIYYCTGSCPPDVAHYDCDWIRLDPVAKKVQIKISGKTGVRTVSLDLFYFYEYLKKNGDESTHVPAAMTSLLESDH